VDNDITGSFVGAHAAVATTLERVLKAGKDFIAVVSTCAVILQSLPSAPRAKRTTMIRGHLETCSRNGATLPENLRQFLDAELKKSRKSDGK